MSFPIDPVINDELKVFEDEGKAVMHRLLQPNVRYFFGPQMFSRIKSILKLEKKLCMAKSKLPNKALDYYCDDLLLEATAILSNAACFIAYHCHPSGNPKPSLEDFEATQRLREAGAILDIKMADHIIVACGRDKTFSFASNNYLEGNWKDNYQKFKNRESWER